MTTCCSCRKSTARSRPDAPCKTLDRRCSDAPPVFVWGKAEQQLNAMFRQRSGGKRYGCRQVERVGAAPDGHVKDATAPFPVLPASCCQPGNNGYNKKRNEAMFSRSATATLPRLSLPGALSALAIIACAATSAPAPAHAGGGLAQMPRNANPQPYTGSIAKPFKPRPLHTCKWIRGYGEGYRVVIARAKAREDLRRKAHLFGPYSFIAGRTGPDCRTVNDIGARSVACEMRRQLCR